MGNQQTCLLLLWMLTQSPNLFVLTAVSYVHLIKVEEGCGGRLQPQYQPAWRTNDKIRTHVLQDLRPYVCTIEGCKDGDRIYGTRSAWIEHERLAHRRVWRCSDRQHIATIHRTEEELRDHFFKSHPGMTKEQIEDVVSLTETTIEDVRNTCPFCNTKGPFPQGLYNHMAFHQEKLALFSLPLNLNEENEDEVASGNALGVGSVRSLYSSDMSQSSEDEKNHSDDGLAMVKDFKAKVAFPTGNLPEVDDPEPETQDAKYNEALHIASFVGDEEAVRTLLMKGAHVSALGEKHGSALHAASSQGHASIVALLLEHGADVNAQGGKYGSALQAASTWGYREITEILLVHGADVNAQGGKAGNALAAAASGGHTEIVELLLDNQADVNASSANFGTVLGAAVYGGSITIMEHLLNHGADIDQSIDTYGTAFCAAIFESKPDIAEVLLERGADIHKEGGNFNNSLGTAAFIGNRQ